MDDLEELSEEGQERRELMKRGVVLLLALSLPPGLLKFVTGCGSTSKEERVMAVVRKVTNAQYTEGQDYKFFPKSSSIQLYLPDNHRLDQEKQLERIQALSSGLKGEELTVGLGLEGIAHGQHSYYAMRELVRRRERLEVEVNSLMEDLNERATDLARALHARGFSVRQAETWVNNWGNEICPQINYLYSAKTAVEYDPDTMIGRLGAPGLSYVCDDILMYGLEDPSTDNLSFKVSSVNWLKCQEFYFQAIALNIMDWASKNGFSGEASPLVGLCINLSGKAKDLYDSCVQHVPENLLADLPEVTRSNFMEIFQSMDFVGGDTHERIALLNRTSHWVGVNHDRDVLLVVGGQNHKSPYKLFAEQLKQSYVLLPNLS